MGALKTDLVAQSWTSFRLAVIAPDAGPLQIQEMRRAFYAGAQGLLGTILRGLGPEDEPTEADLLQMGAITDELSEFALKVARGEA